jgi:hypothetical protein
MRRGEELTSWLNERQEAGIVGLHTSLTGFGAIQTGGMVGLATSTTKSTCCDSVVNAA